jgi:hypothetical protein
MQAVISAMLMAEKAAHICGAALLGGPVFMSEASVARISFD